MTHNDIEHLIDSEAARRLAAQRRVRALAAEHGDQLPQHCTAYRRRRLALRVAATCCLLTAVTLASDRAFAAPGYAARTAHSDATTAVAHIDNIINSL